MTVGKITVNFIPHSGFIDTGTGALSDGSIEFGGETWTVESLFYSPSLGGSAEVDLDTHLPRGSIFNIGGTTFTANSISEQENGRYLWTTSNPGWVEGQKVTVSANLPPVVTGATVDGDQLVLIFAEDLDTGSEPATSAFTVTVAGTAVTVDDVAISGMTVTLTLASEVGAGQTGIGGPAPPAAEVPQSLPSPNGARLRRGGGAVGGSCSIGT